MGTPAEEFGPYVVYEQLGLGGMATVHRAETQGIAGFSKQVALKRMLPSVANDASLVKSFIREARLASHLRHANVAQTYDLGKVGETYFIAMELVPGRNLREILKHCAAVVGHMPLPIALNIISQICDALDYAHNLCDETGSPLGIIHRDVSPSNIIVSEGGVVKLIDFGIAKASARTGMNTMSGTIKGKFGYMAPEYLMGSIDTRADLFALGVIAHELLANRPLFQGKDDMDTLYRVKDMPILPPSRINPKVPPELDSVIMTALDRNPDQRWQRASALRQALGTEIKRLNLYAHNSAVFEWIEKAFQQTKKKAQFEEDSEPLISISSGTAELPRAGAVAALAAAAHGTAPRGPSREVPDEFSGSDGMETLVKPVSRSDRPSANQWSASTETTTPASDAMDRPIGGGADANEGHWKIGTDLPTKLVRKSTPIAAQPDPVDARRDRSGSPHVVQRGDRNGPTRNTPAPIRKTPQPAPAMTSRDIAEHADMERTLRDPLERKLINSRTIEDEDDVDTLPPDARVNTFDKTLDRDDPDDVRTVAPPMRGDRQSTPPAPRAERPSQPPALAPKSDAVARTMMIDPSEHVVRPHPNQPMPLGGPSQPVALDGPSAIKPPSPAVPGHVDPHQRTMLADNAQQPMRTAPAGAFAIGAAPLGAARPTPNPNPVNPNAGLLPVPGVRTLPGAGAPAPASVSPAALAAAQAAQSPVLGGSRTAPRMPVSESDEQIRHARAALDDLATRGERPSANKLLNKEGASRDSQHSVSRTRVEPAKRSTASNFLLAVLVLIAAGGAAAVVYFALPYLT